MKLNVTFWYRAKHTHVIAEGVPTYLEVTKKQFKQIEESFKTGKYQYMTDDPALKEICQPLIDEGNSYGPDWYKEHFAKLEIIAEYPEEIVADCAGIQCSAEIMRAELIDMNEIGGAEK